jgi:acyl transferase domain-containing protein
LTAIQRASEKIKDLLSENERLKKKDQVAVIGIGCRFPGNANSPAEFWNVLEKGVNAVSEIPKDRWNVPDFYKEDKNVPGKMYTKQGHFLNEVDKFDDSFFGISPAEVLNLDPQHRLLLEVSWEAFEDAGISISSLHGSRTGVFIGITDNEYGHAHLLSHDFSKIDSFIVTGLNSSTAAGRISYLYDFTGPSMVVDTACSSSLVAVHQAVSSLLSGESDYALAGGVYLILSPISYIGLCKINALSIDGKCKTFDNSADGFGRGEGCGLVVLKRLSDAIKDNDNILAVISGSAVNHDGKSNGLTAPNGPAQQKVILEALKNANMGIDDIDYIEAHGTGTILGDPIEINSLDSIFRSRKNSKKIKTGSVKTNIGHLEAAAGAAGLIKIILSLKNKKIPPSVNITELNKHINWNELSIEVVKKLTDWTPNGKKRVAGLSSFGFSGTNAHIIIQEPPVVNEKDNSIERTKQVFCLSAKKQPVLNELSKKYIKFLNENKNINFPDQCYTTNSGRDHFKYRLAIIANDNEEIINSLKEFTNRAEEPKNLFLSQDLNIQDRSKIAFVFSGQGTQYVEMAKTLYHTSPFFKSKLEECDELFKKHSNISIVDLLYSANSGEEQLKQTINTQPVIFSIGYALGNLWRYWGIEPSVLLGHSIGEYVAAYFAGVFSLEDAVKLVFERGKLMQEVRNGSMAAVFADAETIESLIDKSKLKIDVAAYNSPSNITISGATNDILDMIKLLSESGIKSKILNVSNAFHSYLMDPILSQFKESAEGIKYNDPVIPIISNLTGNYADKKEITTPEYWVKHIRKPVMFYQSILNLEMEGCEIFLEIGGNPTLSSLIEQTAEKNEDVILNSLKKGNDDWKELLSALAKLYTVGLNVNWPNFEKDYKRNKLELPTYPFQRNRIWLDIPIKLFEESEKINNIPVNIEDSGFAGNQSLVSNIRKKQMKMYSELIEAQNNLINRFESNLRNKGKE